MIKLIIQYPAASGTFFDFDYYTREHIPLGARLLRDYGYLGHEVNRCTTTVRGDEPQFRCITELRFRSLEELRAGMQAHGAELSADFSRYTDIKPIATVCEVVK